MKRQVKILILSILIISGLFFAASIGLIKGMVLIMLAIVGIYIIEARQVKRTADFLEPLLFRCGRIEYVEQGLALLKERLLFKASHLKKLRYLDYGLMNINGQYQELLELSNMISDSEKDSDRLLMTEINYATLKMGKSIGEMAESETHREELVESLNLIQTNTYEQAIEHLLQLREKETGNIIFREVNELLGMLYIDKDPDSAQYYMMIAETFAREMNE